MHGQTEHHKAQLREGLTIPPDIAEIKKAAEKHKEHSDGITLKEMVWYLIDRTDRLVEDTRANTTAITYLKWVVGLTIMLGIAAVGYILRG